jgi:hypothetical protein
VRNGAIVRDFGLTAPDLHTLLNALLGNEPTVREPSGTEVQVLVTGETTRKAER